MQIYSINHKNSTAIHQIVTEESQTTIVHANHPLVKNTSPSFIKTENPYDTNYPQTEQSKTVKSVSININNEN